MGAHALKTRSGAHLRSRGALLALACALGLLASWALRRGSQVEPGYQGQEALLRAAQRQLEQGGHLVAVQQALLPLDSADPQQATRFAAVFTARAPGDAQSLPDLYRISVERAPQGLPVRVGPVFALTHTRDATEALAGQHGQRLLVTSQAGPQLSATLWDFSGESPALVERWSGLDRLKNQVSNWQETGQPQGLGRQLYLFSGAPQVSLEQGALRWQAPGQAASRGRLPEDLSQAPRWELAQGAQAPQVQLQAKGERGHLGWVVDTVRDISWVGPRKIAALEEIAFELVDWGKRLKQSTEDPEEINAPGLAASLGPAPPQLADLATEAEGEGWRLSGERSQGRTWPPRAATPIHPTPGPGEGRWAPMRRLIKEDPEGATLFYQSWLRPDPERLFARVSVTAWDPARLSLGVVAGTREPISTTGLKGSGQIPRGQGELPRLVAAFNGGFQTKHGAYGMVERQRVLVPPAGEAATVLTTTGGQVQLGSWPASAPRPNAWTLAPGAPLPGWVDSLRQNLEPLVAQGRVNPAGRRKWGSTAGQNVDKTHTIRTGICLLEGGALAYFFGASVSADTLGQAMLAFHCQYGVHLDMNAGHSGFEFYHVRDDQGEDFDAERMIEKMWHMNFPRYIRRDARDFFYLTLRTSPQERLEALTGLRWRRPLPQGAQAPQQPTGAPPRALEAELTLGQRRLPLLRLPPQGLRAQLLAQAGPAALEKQRALWAAHLDTDSQGVQGWELAGASLPARPLEEMAGTSGPLLVLVQSQEDLLLVQATGQDLQALRAWLKERPALGQARALALAPDTAPVLRFLDQEGQEALRGGPLQASGRLLLLSLEPPEAQASPLNTSAVLPPRPQDTGGAPGAP